MILGARVNHSWQEYHVIANRNALERLPFVRMAGIGRFERDAADRALEHYVNDVLERNVVVVRTS